MTYLITGVAGFIGSSIAEHLLDQGEFVCGIDNFETSNREDLAHLLDHPNFEFLEGDLRNIEDIQQCLDSVSYVLHQGAVPSVPRSVKNPALSTAANCSGTANLIQAARDTNVKKIVVASSSSVYGPTDIDPKHEDLPANPVSPYALSKYYTEQLAIQANKYYNFDTVALRYFNVFGPRQDPNGDYAAVIPKFINLMLSGEQPIIYGDGTQSRDFTYIDNVIEANLLAINSNTAGEALNVGCGSSITINDLVDEINRIMGTDINPIYDDPRPGDVPHSKADIGKSSELINYEPDIKFCEGLDRTIEWFSQDNSLDN